MSEESQTNTINRDGYVTLCAVILKEVPESTAVLKGPGGPIEIWFRLDNEERGGYKTRIQVEFLLEGDSWRCTTSGENLKERIKGQVSYFGVGSINDLKSEGQSLARRATLERRRFYDLVHSKEVIKYLYEPLREGACMVSCDLGEADHLVLAIDLEPHATTAQGLYDAARQGAR